MRTRSSLNLIVESSTTPKRRNRRRSKQRVEPFSLEETSVVTMADQRTMAELLQAPTEGYVDAIVIPAILAEHFELKHGLLNLATSKQFYGSEKEDPHAHIHCTNAPSSYTPQFSEIVALADSVKAMLLQKSSPPASVKAVEEICVTCGGPHPYHHCLATDGNAFPEYQDNIQRYVSAAAVNYNQGNTEYRPQSIANQIRPPGFAQPNLQNNQTRYNQGNHQALNNQGFNQRGQNFNQGNNNYQALSYLAPIQQAHVGPSNELSNYMKVNEANMRAMQNQISNMKKE
ncbi:hypothetical protein Tco_1290898, partial [Tanacetum coccineum]